MQSKHVRRFLPDVDSLYLLTNLLSTLWPTGCKVSLCTGPLPPCTWPSTLLALYEWMPQKQILSVERLGYLAINTAMYGGMEIILAIGFPETGKTSHVTVMLCLMDRWIFFALAAESTFALRVCCKAFTLQKICS